MSNAAEKKIVWVTAAKRELMALPAEVVRFFGTSLGLIQNGITPPNAAPLSGLKGVSGTDIMEIRKNFQTNTYRAMYTVKFGETVYVLHCFQKKSKSGIGMTEQEKELIAARFKAAQKEHEESL